VFEADEIEEVIRVFTRIESLPPLVDQLSQVAARER
jgi:hypothetical protein